MAGSARWYVNNTIGNVMLNALAGVGPLDYVKFGGKQYDKYIPDQIKEQIAKGAVGTERTSRYGLVGKAAEKIHVTGIVESLYGINQKIEGWFRGVHYKKMAYQYANDIYKGDPGMYTRLADFAKAHDFEGDVKGIMATDKGIQQKSIDSVDKFLFDYSNLTQFERNTIRRAIPFYSWYKNIFRLTAQTAYEQPAKLALMYKLYQGLGPVADPDMPQWIRNKIPVPLTFKDPNTGKTQPMFLNVRAAVPFFDVLKMTDPNEIMASLNPIAKVAIERSLKIQLFTGRPFTSPYYNTYTGMVYDKNSGLAVQGPPLPSLLRHIGMQIPAFTFIEDIVKPYAKYDSGDPITTPSGEAKYPNAVFVTLLKQAGINLMPFDAAQYIQSQKSKAQSTITSGKKVQRGIQQFNLNQESKKKVDQKLEDVKVYQPIF